MYTFYCGMGSTRTCTPEKALFECTNYGILGVNESQGSQGSHESQESQEFMVFLAVTHPTARWIYVEADDSEEKSFFMVDANDKAKILAEGWADVNVFVLSRTVTAISEQDHTPIASNPSWADRVQESVKEALKGKSVKVVGKDPMHSARHECVGPPQFSTW